MKVLGIGNAIVDVICKVEESFLSENNLTKSTMKLVDESEFKTILSNLKIQETIAGGSVANSIVGLSQLGNEVSYIGKVNNDELGNKYEKSLINEKVKYCYSKKKEELPTGTCLILITPDSERTMCTFLGTAGKINENDVDVNAVKNSEITFLEGYLWDEGDPKSAFDKAIQNSNKVVMSLSDLFALLIAFSNAFFGSPSSHKYPSKNVISLFLTALTSTSFSLIFPAIPRNVHIVLSESGVINIKQVPVGNSSFFLE